MSRNPSSASTLAGRLDRLSPSKASRPPRKNPAPPKPDHGLIPLPPGPAGPLFVPVLTLSGGPPSTTATLRDRLARASSTAAISPAGPAPTTATSTALRLPALMFSVILLNQSGPLSARKSPTFEQGAESAAKISPATYGKPRPLGRCLSQIIGPTWPSTLTA